MTEPEPIAARAAARRRQVLDAASHCFRRQGFHSTSMAQIASQAGMSVGHIYRYFAGKEDIIEAIVRADIEEQHAMMTELEASPDDAFRFLVERADQGVMRMADPERAALILEIRAEATRNPKVAAMLQALDKELLENLGRVLVSANPAAWSEAEVESRTQMLALIFEGILLRVVAKPDLDLDALLAMIRLVISAILAH